MNPHPIIDPRLPGFSDEERELARALADGAPAGTPSAGLDARILAAARVAFAPARPSMTPRRPRRWPVALGLAASVVLATGVAWQLRPLPEPPVFRTVRVADNAPARRAQEAPSYRRAVVAPAVDDALPAPAIARPGSAQVSAAAAEKTSRKAVIAPVVALPAPGSMLPETAAATDAADAATAAPAPPPPAAAADRSARPVSASARAAAPAPILLPPDAWIDRIRLLRDAGRLTEARADLRAMRAAHPQAPIPVDLRSLAD